MRGREASDSKKSHEDLANFQRTLNERGQEMFDSGTNGSKAIKSGPQVLAALSLGNAPSGLPRRCSSKESACQGRKQETRGLIPGSGRSPGGRNNNPLQYSCLENSMDRGAWQWATKSRGCKEQDTTENEQARMCTF